jgi:hypothetical protein
MKYPQKKIHFRIKSGTLAAIVSIYKAFPVPGKKPGIKTFILSTKSVDKPVCRTE